MSFQISALSPAQFEPLFELSDEALKQRGMSRFIVDCENGYPDRITLKDANLGDELILLNFEHQPAPTAYNSKGPIFVSRGGAEPHTLIDTIPDSLSRRMLSFRGYSKGGDMLEGEVIDGKAFRQSIEAFFANENVAYIHVHFASRGCYAARVDRLNV